MLRCAVTQYMDWIIRCNVHSIHPCRLLTDVLDFVCTAPLSSVVSRWDVVGCCFCLFGSTMPEPFEIGTKLNSSDLPLANVRDGGEECT